jgi:hypothetical protein
MKTMINEVIEVYGYHGTSQDRATSILQNGFLASDNDYTKSCSDPCLAKIQSDRKPTV